MSRGGAPGGGAVVLDVAQLEALLTRTFSIGLDVGRGREKVALVRLRLSKALPGAAETQAMAAEALAIEQGVATEQIAAAEGLALHAAAFNGMPDPVLHLAARAMGVVTGLAVLEPDRAPPAPTCFWTPPCRPPPACSSSWPSGMTAPPSPPRRSRPPPPPDSPAPLPNSAPPWTPCAPRVTPYSTRTLDVARLSPFVREHVNVVGKYNFLLPDLGEGVIRQLRDPDAADDELPD